MFPWLVKDGNYKRCKACNVNIMGGIVHIKRHSSCDSHKKKVEVMKTTPKIDAFMKNPLCPTEQSAKKLEIMLTMFVAEHNLPFTILDHLNSLIKQGISDSQIVKKININRKKAKQIVTEVIGPENVKEIKNFCKDNYYSIVLDESTDCSVSKNLAIIIRIFDNKCRDRFLGLIKIEDCTANGIFDATIKMLSENDIPLNQIVGITTDNCAVMMGSVNGVQTKLKAIIPHLFTNGCICHILNLVSLAASKYAISYEIEKFMRDINHHFCNSSSRREEFIKFQEYFGTDVHIILKYSCTRWLSRQEVIERILEQWEPLHHYFILNDFESDFKNFKLQFIISIFSKPIFKMTFLFLKYILKIINSINLEMQAEDARIHIILERLTFLFRQIARNFLKKDVLDKYDITELDLKLESNYVPLKDVYCGTDVDIYSNK